MKLQTSKEFKKVLVFSKDIFLVKKAKMLKATMGHDMIGLRRTSKGKETCP
jgi:hypothetical protein